MPFRAWRTASILLLLGGSGGGTKTVCKIEDWALNVTAHQSSVFSQGGQDGTLEYIFSKIGTTNKYFVEFGFNTQTYEDPRGTGSNTRNLWANHGWNGLLMDASYSNASINLHPEFITAANVNALFEKYAVPRDVDYVSVDIDSTDLWIFRALLSQDAYRPRVLSVEYNCVFPVQSTITCHQDCRWQDLDRLYGTSLGALLLVAEEYGYALVDIVHTLDAVFVRRDQLQGSLTPTRKYWEKWPACVVHNPVANISRLYSGELIDYAAWSVGGDAVASAGAQLKNLNIEYLMINEGWRVKQILEEQKSPLVPVEDSSYEMRKREASRLGIPILGIARGDGAGIVQFEEKYFQNVPLDGREELIRKLVATCSTSGTDSRPSYCGEVPSEIGEAQGDAP